MKVELRQKIECATAREAIRGLLVDDSKVSVFDGGQATPRHSTDAIVIEAAMFTTDEDQLHVEHQHAAEKGQVLLIYGNGGRGVITDHTANLELSPKGAPELADKIADEDPTTLVCVLAEVGVQRF